MNKELLLTGLVMILLIGCAKDDAEPTSQSSSSPAPTVPAAVVPGVLEGYLNLNPRISVIKTVNSSFVYESGVTTWRGYIFTVKNNAGITLTAFGGRIAKPGVYRFMLRDLTSYLSSLYPIFEDSIVISDVNKFTYKDIPNVSLRANTEYLLDYFNNDHSSVYDAGLGINQPDTVNRIKFPLKIGDIQIELPYYTYDYMAAGTFNAGLLRGLVDFKYK
jgi:hypothetical protein